MPVSKVNAVKQALVAKVRLVMPARSVRKVLPVLKDRPGRLALAAPR
jgi:hypothetical protein